MTQYAGADAVAGGASGGVSKVESTSGDLTVTTTSGTTDLAVAKVPSAAVVVGTRLTGTTTAGRLKLVADVQSGALTHATTILTPSITLTLNTVVNILSVSLAAGTWLLLCGVLLSNPTSANDPTVLLVVTSNGATITFPALVQTRIHQGATGLWILPVTLAVIVTPTATTTYYLNAKAITAAAKVTRGTTAKANYMTAVKIA